MKAKYMAKSKASKVGNHVAAALVRSWNQASAGYGHIPGDFLSAISAWCSHPRSVILVDLGLDTWTSFGSTGGVRATIRETASAVRSGRG
jgi:hypothetical protein